MALSDITAAHIADVMESNMTPHNNNPLKDKVVHADIVVHGIDDGNIALKRDDISVPLVEQPKPSAQDVEDQARAEEMRTWWNNDMKKHMNQPDGYAKVAVLLIKWADELDELKTKDEVLELESLFRDRFHYQTKTIELNVRKRPQLQLDNHISNFLLEHDGPHSLLIVYYTGHGLFHDDRAFLELTACNNLRVCRGFSGDAKANWNKVEEKLRDEEVEGDVLTILDTCYASNLVKASGNQASKKFELMAASAIDETTSSPGEYSFTRALIDGLKTLLDAHAEPISTFRIIQSINLNKKRRDTPAHVWARNHHNDAHIFLAPQRPSDLSHPSSFRAATGGYLTLRFGLRDARLNKEQIEYMTKTLSNALFNKALIGLRKVEWLDMRAAPEMRSHFDRVALVVYAVTQWRKIVRERKVERERKGMVVEFSSQEMDGAMTKQKQMKRKHGDVDDRDAKRQYLDAVQAPSPPVSDSSHIE